MQRITLNNMNKHDFPNWVKRGLLSNHIEQSSIDLRIKIPVELREFCKKNSSEKAYD